jgi:pyruvate kinase
MRRTRILTTLGPASADAETLRALLDAGTDAFRLNFSHGSIESHRETCGLIREVAASAGRHVAVLQDLSGPKIRIGPIDTPFDLAPDDALRIEQGRSPGGPGRVSCAFDALFTSVPAGERLLIDDGRIELEVTAVSPGVLDTRVVTGGRLSAHKGINVPGVPLRTSALTDKDVEDLRAGIAMGVDLAALSFVQSPDDIARARAVATEAGAPDLPLFAKIEKPRAVEIVDEILKVADGLIVARGDLGIEMPLERLPSVQRQLVLAARRRGLPSIVATQVLESMRHQPRPTRAEVTDAAHVVDEGADAIMLAGETAIGRYPVRAVQVLDTILREAERTAPPLPRVEAPAAQAVEHGRALCEAAVTLAERARAIAVVAVTGSGQTARMLAALRPSARVFAATASPQTGARLSLVWGVTPVVTPEPTLESVRETLTTLRLVPVGAVVVFVSMHPSLGRETTNFVHVETV